MESGIKEDKNANRNANRNVYSLINLIKQIIKNLSIFQFQIKILEYKYSVVSFQVIQK